MVLLHYFRFFFFLVYAIMGGYILYKNPKSLLNITCALIISSFAIWTIADPYLISKNITKDTVTLLNNIASIGWISIASFSVCFALVFSKREKLLKKKRVLVLIFILPVILLYKQWTVGLNNSPILEDFGWYLSWKESFWTYLFYVYNFSFMLICIYIIYRHGTKTKLIAEKKQSKIIFATVNISMIGVTIIDLIMPVLHIHIIPQIGSAFLFVFAGGCIYAIVKYEFLTISLAIAAENIISTMEELLILTDIEGKILNVNNAVIDSLKYEQKELTGQSVAIFFRENSLITSFLGKITAGEIVRSYEANLLAKDSSEIPIIISGSPLKDKQGDVRGIVFIATDIAEQKQVEEILRESEEKYSFLVQNSQDIIFTINLDGIFTYVSPAWTILLGQPICDVIGKSFQQFVHSDDVLKCMSLMQEILEAGQSQKDIEYRVQHIDGSWRWHSSHGAPIKNEKGEFVGFHGIGRDITARMQMEEDLIESERLLRESQEIARLGSFSWNISKGIWTSSKILDRIFGIDESYIHSFEGWLAIIHPDFREIMQNYVSDDILRKQQKFDKEYKIINQENKQELWVYGLGQLEFDSNHQPIKLIGTITDITERKNQENEIISNLKRLKTLVDILQYPSNSIQEYLDFALNHAIEMTESKIGYIYFYNEEKKEFVLNSWSNEVMSECAIIEKQTIYQLEKTGIWGEPVRQRKPIVVNDYQMPNPLKKGYPDGHVSLHKYLTIPVFVNNIIVAVVAVANKKSDYTDTDTTQLTILMDIVWKVVEKKKLDVALYESEELYRVIMESVNLGISMIDVNHKIIMTNNYFANAFQKPQNDFVGKYCYNEFEKREAICPHCPAVLTMESGKPMEVETVGVRDDGSNFDTLLRTAPTYSSDGSLSGFIEVAEDITERKLVAEEIRFKNQQLLKLNAEKDKFFSIIAHDLRSPLSGIMGLTEIMADDLSSLTMDEILEFSVSLRNSASSLSQLLDNLLQWSQIQGGAILFNPEIVQLHPIVAECIATIQDPAKNKEIKITSEISNNIEVFADRNMLQTVIRNLVSNAVKFTHKGGKISILAKVISCKCVEISVTDTGIGMSQSMVENLFRIDVKTNRNGTEGEPSTGLGLILCKEFVERQGGKIWAESEEESGTRFCFTVPMT